MTCLICGVDDGLYLLCGRHWSEYVKWEREQHDDEHHPAKLDGFVTGL